MKKIIAILFLFSVAASLPWLLVSTPDFDKKLHTDCIYPTALISNEFHSHGTGVVLRSEKQDGKYINVVLTCQHVLDGHPIKIYLTDYVDSISRATKSYNAWTYAQNLDDDLAVVIFESDTKIPIAKIDFQSDLHLGNEVLGVGCSQMENPRVDYGKVTEVGFRIRTSIFTIPGDSGGPVYYRYKLIGIKQSIIRIRYGFSLLPVFTISNVVPITKLQEWDVKEKGKLGFVYDKTKQLPKLPSLMFNFYEMDEPTRSPFGGVFPQFEDEIHTGKVQSRPFLASPVEVNK